MAMLAMQIVLASTVLAIAKAMAALSASAHQNTAHQRTTHKSAVHEATSHKSGQPEVALSFDDFVNQKQNQSWIQTRKTHFSYPQRSLPDENGITHFGPTLHPLRMLPDENGHTHQYPQQNLQGGHRHKASLTAFSSHLHQQAPPPVQYIPKIGVGNVTTPTELPPPPPTLNPDTDMQPFDTRLGNWMAASFLAPPTVTPPPTQEALDLAYGCPVLLGFPTTVQVEVPNQCPNQYLSTSARNGTWKHPQGLKLMLYEEICDIREATLPFIKYLTPAKELFAYSRTRFTLFGNIMEIVNCGDQIRFTIEEKIYHQTGFTDEEKCRKYKSCSGTIFLQYYIKDHLGKTIGETPYINLFQDKFDISEPGSGMLIATIERMGLWSPWDTCTDYEKLWMIKFPAAPPGIFGAAENRWPIAILLNMMILRDTDRMSSGMVKPSTCEIRNVVILSVLIVVTLIMIILLSFLFMHYCFAKAKLFFWNMEVTLMPHTMYKPSKYDG